MLETAGLLHNSLVIREKMISSVTNKVGRDNYMARREQRLNSFLYEILFGLLYKCEAVYLQFLLKKNLFDLLQLGMAKGDQPHVFINQS
jgi:hypothetical protein